MKAREVAGVLVAASLLLSVFFTGCDTGAADTGAAGEIPLLGGWKIISVEKTYPSQETIVLPIDVFADLGNDDADGDGWIDVDIDSDGEEEECWAYMYVRISETSMDLYYEFSGDDPGASMFDSTPWKDIGVSGFGMYRSLAESGEVDEIAEDSMRVSFEGGWLEMGYTVEGDEATVEVTVYDEQGEVQERQTVTAQRASQEELEEMENAPDFSGLL
ncbi:hypothetical protein [Spirochaeta thermophila]|uniref:Lipocalin-like domain-containing protein n=1 Tax=Winmispira thermophila (strain ATCC 49972 / DSM 6192 / RI 19.B1) TaxID=665571 RepID=E0RNP1_WINT6|nr:hypothetical protein [Spirochaeta thermophila]ADN02632.1 hypothetical protein STHERM_c16960 [Spirochaeta thermophila DSM 6192]